MSITTKAPMSEDYWGENLKRKKLIKIFKKDITTQKINYPDNLYDSFLSKNAQYLCHTWY